MTDRALPEPSEEEVFRTLRPLIARHAVTDAALRNIVDALRDSDWLCAAYRVDGLAIPTTLSENGSVETFAPSKILRGRIAEWDKVWAVFDRNWSRRALDASILDVIEAGERMRSTLAYDLNRATSSGAVKPPELGVMGELTMEQQRDAWRQQYIYASEENAEFVARLGAERLSPEADERLTVSTVAWALHAVNACTVHLDGPFGCRYCYDLAAKAVKASPLLRVALLAPASVMNRLYAERDDAVAKLGAVALPADPTITCGAWHHEADTNDVYRGAAEQLEGYDGPEGCGRKAAWWLMYRCVECGRWFQRERLAKKYEEKGQQIERGFLKGHSVEANEFFAIASILRDSRVGNEALRKAFVEGARWVWPADEHAAGIEAEALRRYPST